MSFGFAANSLAALFISSAADLMPLKTVIASDFCSGERSFELLISFFAASILASYDGASSALLSSVFVQYSALKVL